MATEDIRRAFFAHPEICQINEALVTNQLQLIPKPFQDISDELFTTDGILLCVILAHEDHVRITRTKQRLRSKLWSPKIDTAVEE